MSIGYIEQMNNGRWSIQCGTEQQCGKYYLTSSDTMDGAIRILKHPDIPEDSRVPTGLDDVTEIYLMKDFCFGARKGDFASCAVMKIKCNHDEKEDSNGDDESYSLLFPDPYFVYHHEAKEY